MCQAERAATSVTRSHEDLTGAVASPALCLDRCPSVRRRWRLDVPVDRHIQAGHEPTLCLSMSSPRLIHAQLPIIYIQFPTTAMSDGEKNWLLAFQMNPRCPARRRIGHYTNVAKPCLPRSVNFNRQVVRQKSGFSKYINI